MDEIEVGLDWDELHPVFILVTDQDEYRQRNVKIDRALLKCYEAADREWQAVQKILYEIEQTQRP